MKTKITVLLGVVLLLSIYWLSEDWSDGESRSAAVEAIDPEISATPRAAKTAFEAAREAHSRVRSAPWLDLEHSVEFLVVDRASGEPRGRCPRAPSLSASPGSTA